MAISFVVLKFTLLYFLVTDFKLNRAKFIRISPDASLTDVKLLLQNEWLDEVVHIYSSI